MPDYESATPRPDDLADWEALAAQSFESDTPAEARLLPQELIEASSGGEVVVERALPAEHTGQPPIFFGNGYAARPDNTAYVIQLAKTGREAFAFTYTGDHFKDTAYGTADAWQPGDDLALRSRRDVYRQYKAEDRTDPDRLIVSSHKAGEAADLLRYLRERGDGPVDAIFQSADVLTGTLAAYAAPHRFDNIWLAYGAGLAGQTRPQDLNWQHGARMMLRRTGGIEPANDIRRLADDARDPSIGDTPLPMNDRFVTGGAVLYSNHAPLLPAIARQPHAPGITMVAGLYDGIFSPERLLGSLRSPDDISYLVVTEAGHSISYRQDVLEQLLRYAPRNARGDGPDANRSLTERLILPPSIEPQRRDRLLHMADNLDRL